jgi:hypothetical protein
MMKVLCGHVCLHSDNEAKFKAIVPASNCLLAAYRRDPDAMATSPAVINEESS